MVRDSEGISSLKRPGMNLPVAISSVSISATGQQILRLVLSLLSQLCSVSIAIVICCTFSGHSKNGALKQHHLFPSIPSMFSDILQPLEIW